MFLVEQIQFPKVDPWRIGEDDVWLPACGVGVKKRVGNQEVSWGQNDIAVRHFLKKKSVITLLQFKPKQSLKGQLGGGKT